MDISLDGMKELAKALSGGNIIEALEKAYPTFLFQLDHKGEIDVLRRPVQTERVVPKLGKTDIVPALLRYLNEAQQGNIAEIAIACLWTDNQYGFTVSSARLEMLGAVDHMKHAMITSVE